MSIRCNKYFCFAITKAFVVLSPTATSLTLCVHLTTPKTYLHYEGADLEIEPGGFDPDGDDDDEEAYVVKSWRCCRTSCLHFNLLRKKTFLIEHHCNIVIPICKRMIYILCWLTHHIYTITSQADKLYLVGVSKTKNTKATVSQEQTK